MYKSILVSFDNSAQSKNALRNAVMLAEACGAKVTVVSVVDSFDFNELHASQQDVLIEQTADIVGDYSDVTYYAVTGKPQEAIVDYGKSGDYDLIVMGCRGLGGFRGVVGSVSHAVVQYVDIPVMLVK